MATKEKQELSAGFTKDQFLQSRQWQGIDKDILSVVLEPGKVYTIAEAKRLVEDFKKGQVKG